MSYLCFKMSWDKFSLDFTGPIQISLGHTVPQDWKMLWCWCVVSACPQASELDLALTFCLLPDCHFCVCVGCAQSHNKESLYLWRLCLSMYACSGLCFFFFFFNVCTCSQLPLIVSLLYRPIWSCLCAAVSAWKLLYGPQLARLIILLPLWQLTHRHMGLWVRPLQALQVIHHWLDVCVYVCE